MAVRFEEVTIADTEAVSGGLQLAFGERIVGVITPAEWDAADIGFDASDDGGTTWFNVVDPARAAATSHARIVNVATTAAAYYIVPECMDREISGRVRLRSINTASNADAAQSPARTLNVAIEKVN